MGLQCCQRFLATDMPGKPQPDYKVHLALMQAPSKAGTAGCTWANCGLPGRLPAAKVPAGLWMTGVHPQLVKRIYLLCDLSMTPMQVSIGHHIIRWPETGLNQDIADMAVSFLGCSCFDSKTKHPRGLWPRIQTIQKHAPITTRDSDIL